MCGDAAAAPRGRGARSPAGNAGVQQSGRKGVAQVASLLTPSDEMVRSDHRPSPRRGRSFAFLDRSAWPAAENARTVLESWFADYPDGAKADLRARFRRPDHNHESAFFELLLHQVFLRLGLAPEVHPELRTGRSRPDFSIRSRRRVYYVEANVAGVTGDLAEDALEDEVLDALDGLAAERPTRIAVSAATRGKLHRSVSSRSIKNEVRPWIERIEPLLITQGRPSEHPQLEIRRGAWALTLTAFHVLSRPSKRLIHMGPTKTAWSNDGESLRKNILEKAKQHGSLERPLIIAINTQNAFQDREEEMAALFGREQMIVEGASSENVVSTRVSREPEAVWRDRSGSRYTRVHGVLFFRGVVPWNAHNATSCLYVNPFIDAEVPAELLRLGRATVQDDRMVWEAGEPLGDLLGLPQDWPGEKTPER